MGNPLDTQSYPDAYVVNCSEYAEYAKLQNMKKVQNMQNMQVGSSSQRLGP